MLKQDAVPETQAAPVGQARVTPDELAHALAAIDARRQAEAAHLAGTIPIDQAVSDLHLDSTSDEIWAEVQARRADASAAHAAHMDPKQERPQQKVATPPSGRRRGWRGYAASAVIVWALFSAGIIPQFWNRTTPSVTHHLSYAAPILRSLSQIPNGTEVFADAAALTQVSEGKPLTQIPISINSTGNRWTLVKMDGHVYLRGYIASADALDELQGKALDVYNDNDSGGLHRVTTSNITLRVDNTPLQKSGSSDSYSEITVPGFQPDPLTTLTQGN